ncbi:MAG: PAS domain S-box protein [Desulfatibacillum sp.]|nr:PAS domain S-box protein [Desulfatibacillum sp.]
MSSLSMPIAIAATLTMGAGIFNALVYMRQSARREYLSFSIACFLMVFYDIFSIYLYSSSHPEQAFFWLKARMLVLAPTAVALVWFLHDYTGHPNKKPVYAFTIYFVSALLLGLIAPGGMVWVNDAPVLRLVDLPFGFHVAFYELVLSPLGFLRFIVRLVLLVYFSWVILWFLKRTSLRKGLAMVCSFTFFFVGLANDTAVRLGLYDFIYVMEFAFLGVVLFMTYELANEIVEAAAIRDQLAESEKRYRLLAENISDNVWTLGLDLRFTYVSPSIMGLLGYTPKEIVGTDVLEILSPDSRDIVRQALADALEEKLRFPEKELQRRFRVQSVRKDKSLVHVEIQAGFLYDEFQTPLGIVGVSRDVEAQVKAEAALRESEEKYRRMYESIQDVYFEADLDGIIQEVSPSISTVTQYSREDLIGRNMRGLSLHPEERADRLASIAETGRINDYEVAFRDKDGSVIRTAITAAFLLDEEGKPLGTVGTIRNIEARKKMEEALRESETRFRILAENSTDVIWTMTLGGAFTYVSPSVERLTGFTVDQLLKMTLEDYVTPESLTQIHSLMAEELARGPVTRVDPVTMEVQQYAKDGSIIDIEVSANWILNEIGQPVGIRGATRDIRARKIAEKEKQKLEAQLLQARKMEAIGTLAGGIAHDFNNILHPVMGYAQMLLAEDGHGESTREALEEIMQAAKRAKDLVSQILTFGRRSAEIQTCVSLDAIVQEALGLLKASIPSTIEIRQEIKKPGASVYGDFSQLHQVVMNLCTNAYQAMRNKGGVLIIGLEEVNLTHEDKETSLDLPKGAYQKLSVTDSGPGIAPAVMERLYEPYFTTKEVGEGTGMGLAVVHAIVKKHRGEIRVRSSIEGGTTFEVYLPAVEGFPEPVSIAIVADAPGGKERLLIVDDEGQVLRLTQRMLEKLGYRIQAEQDSNKALELFASDPRAFDLVLTDMTMPGLTGEDLAKRILEIRPDIPIILCTGYADIFSQKQARELGFAQCLYKPLDRQLLAQTLRTVLSRKN